jgi:lysine 2,3-aminomutase
MRELRGRVSGLCQPEYVLDIPGGAGKVPIGPQWIGQQSDGRYDIADYLGATHDYVDGRLKRKPV